MSRLAWVTLLVGLTANTSTACWEPCDGGSTQCGDDGVTLYICSHIEREIYKQTCKVACVDIVTPLGNSYGACTLSPEPDERCNGYADSYPFCDGATKVSCEYGYAIRATPCDYGCEDGTCVMTPNNPDAGQDASDADQ